MVRTDGEEEEEEEEKKKAKVLSQQNQIQGNENRRKRDAHITCTDIQRKGNPSLARLLHPACRVLVRVLSLALHLPLFLSSDHGNVESGE